MNKLSNVISMVISLGIVLMMLAGTVFIAVAILSALIVPLTWVWGYFTDQSYDRVCDNSEILYQLNQVGKWTLVIGVALVFFYWIV
jgi:hypothetical protein